MDYQTCLSSNQVTSSKEKKVARHTASKYKTVHLVTNIVDIKKMRPPLCGSRANVCLAGPNWTSLPLVLSSSRPLILFSNLHFLPISQSESWLP